MRLPPFPIYVCICYAHGNAYIKHHNLLIAGSIKLTYEGLTLTIATRNLWMTMVRLYSFLVYILTSRVFPFWFLRIFLSCVNELCAKCSFLIGPSFKCLKSLVVDLIDSYCLRFLVFVKIYKSMTTMLFKLRMFWLNNLLVHLLNSFVRCYRMNAGSHHALFVCVFLGQKTFSGHL